MVVLLSGVPALLQVVDPSRLHTMYYAALPCPALLPVCIVVSQAVAPAEKASRWPHLCWELLVPHACCGIKTPYTAFV
jgi:hypothetical protein